MANGFAQRDSKNGNVSSAFKGFTPIGVDPQIDESDENQIEASSDTEIDHQPSPTPDVTNKELEEKQKEIEKLKMQAEELQKENSKLKKEVNVTPKKARRFEKIEWLKDSDVKRFEIRELSEYLNTLEDEVKRANDESKANTTVPLKERDPITKSVIVRGLIRHFLARMDHIDYYDYDYEEDIEDVLSKIFIEL
jgi:hypothetical protein